MSDALAALKERGFFEQCSNEAELSRLLSTETVTYYAGFDCTADSLHVGHMMGIMAMAHLQRAGHRPIAIVGGGTTMIGDPSFRADDRRIMPVAEIEANSAAILGQLKRFLDLNGDRGLFRNNADWLVPMRYIDFLRDVGRHFRVNEMLRTEAYRTRFERGEGLSFIEFNYQLLQSYDFLYLFQREHCLLQVGGSDQWGNVVAGIDLIRREEGKEAFALTFPLLMTASGQKMGKTVGGAVWLAREKTSPYDFYQYWINVDDRDVQKLLGFFTFLPMEEVRRLGSFQDAAIRQAKETLAYEVTKLTHGVGEADKARAAAQAAFGGSGDLASVPTKELEKARLSQGISVVDLLLAAGLTASKAEARRLVEQGGAYVNEQAVTDITTVIDASRLDGGALMLRSGKKKYLRVVFK